MRERDTAVQLVLLLHFFFKTVPFLAVLQITDWGVQNASLEDVFVRMYGHDDGLDDEKAAVVAAAAAAAAAVGGADSRAAGGALASFDPVTVPPSRRGEHDALSCGEELSEFGRHSWVKDPRYPLSPLVLIVYYFTHVFCLTHGRWVFPGSAPEEPQDRGAVPRRDDPAARGLVLLHVLRLDRRPSSRRTAVEREPVPGEGERRRLSLVLSPPVFAKTAPFLLQVLRTPERIPIGPIPLCEPIRGSCFTFAYTPTGDATVEAIVDNIRANNDPPIGPSGVIGFATAAEADVYALANAETVQGAVHFQVQNDRNIFFELQVRERETLPFACAFAAFLR